MIYTVGRTESYRKYMEQCGEECKKLGKGFYKGKDYTGGSVWKTSQEAKEYLILHELSSYSVWEIDADWDKDTEENPDNSFRNLLVTSRIVREIL